MERRNQFRWIWRRLGRMSVLEVVHRLLEQVKRTLDRARPADWTRIGDLSGAVCGLPGFERPDQVGDDFRNRLAEEAQAALDGRFRLLGQAWAPSHSVSSPWWRTDLWLTDPISGRRWPGAERFAFDVSYREDGERGDVKFVWELNRLQFLPPLALHALSTRDEAASRAVFDILRGWMSVNPPYRGVNWISGIEAASRVVSLLASLSFVRPMTAEDQRTVRVFLKAHIDWIERYPSRFSSANNHRIAELTAIFLASLCTRQSPRSGKAARKAQKNLEREMRRQFHPDGVGAEQSIAYAAYSLEWFALAGLAGEAMGREFSQSFKARAGAALQYLCWTIDEAGQAPCIGDGDDGRVLALTQAPEPRYVASVAAMAARWLGAPEPKSALRSQTLRDLLGPPTSTALAPSGVRTFGAGGMTLWRLDTSGGALVLAFDHGPLGHLSIAAHGHADALAVWLSWGAEAVLVDPGTHLYHAAEGTRDILRGTAAHNTLSIGGGDQSRIVGPFAWSDHARVRLIQAAPSQVDAKHDGYLRRYGLIHRRRVRVDADQIVIEDRLEGRAKIAPLPWSLGFTLAPNVETTVDGSCARIRTPAGRRMVMTNEVYGAQQQPWVLTPTPYAPTFGSLCSTKRLELAGANWEQDVLIRTQIVFAPDKSHQDKPS